MPTSWWYGIGAPAPAGTIDFYTVVLHEIGHGIGVLSLVTLSTGAKNGGFDDAYERWLFDLTAGLGWPAMTDAQRLASSVNTGNVVFQGAFATEAARGLLTAGLNGTYPRVFAPNPVQRGSSISHFDTVVTPNELMEPSITPPPGPYAFLTSGAAAGRRVATPDEWRLRLRRRAGTWTWNDHEWSCRKSTPRIPRTSRHGTVISSAVYSSGTWLWNGTTGVFTQLTGGIPQTLRACGSNLLWAGAAYGTWRYNSVTGWQLLSASNPESIQCFGGQIAWESAAGTWLYNFTTGWTQISSANPAGILPCGARLAWWSGGAGTWFYSAGSWTQISGLGAQTTACYRSKIAWESAAGTWLYDFSTGWTQISGNNPDQILAWGPTLVLEGAVGTWVYDQSGVWTQISAANPTQLAVLSDRLLWADASGIWVWSGVANAGGGSVGPKSAAPYPRRS